jgi:hypothetical protein
VEIIDVLEPRISDMLDGVEAGGNTATGTGAWRITQTEAMGSHGTCSQACTSQLRSVRIWRKASETALYGRRTEVKAGFTLV